MINFSLFGAAALTVAVVTPVFAADPPWDGSWKLDQTKSMMTGETFSYTITPDGKIQFSNGSTITYTFACDGKPYPTVGTQTVACTKAGPSEYDFAYTANGKTLESEVDTLSADGTSMVAAETVQRADGTKETSSDTYSRVSGTGGLAGTWKDVKSSSDSSFSFDLTTSSSGLTLSVPEYKETIALKLDGSPSPVTGPNVSPGEVWIAKSVRSNEFTANEEIAGKPISDFDFALNPDGKTMVVSIWAPGKESEKTVYLYVKQ